MSFNQISYINFFSKNNKELIQFYRSLGMEPLSEIQSDKWYGFNTSMGKFSIEPMSNREKVAKELEIKREDAVLIQFKAKDIAELKEMTERLKFLKINILREMVSVSYGTITNFLDPEGNLLEILLENE